MAVWQSIENMSVDTAILKAYALASQCRYIEAGRELKSVPETLEAPHSMDLYAWILRVTGQRSETRRLWEALACAHPDFESAAKTLEAFAKPPPSDEEDDDADIAVKGLSNRLMIADAAVVVVGVPVSVVSALKGGRTEERKPIVLFTPYVVKRGETIGGARRFKFRIPDFRVYNQHINNIDLVREGQTVNIPGKLPAETVP